MIVRFCSKGEAMAAMFRFGKPAVFYLPSASSTPVAVAVASAPATATATATRFHSSTPPRQPKNTPLTDPPSPPANDPPPISHPQSFVKTYFQPGEYDPSRSDPLHRPPWKNRARIISAEDFAARPQVTYDDEFDSMHDAMVTLSWLTEEQRQGMYTLYLNLMTEASNDGGGGKDGTNGTKGTNGRKDGKGTTSHEYAMHVVAQRYNVTPSRAGAVVQNCHDEEQAAKRGDYVHAAAQEFVDAKIREHINNCYSAYGEIGPDGFVEDPVGVVPGATDPEIGQRGTRRVEDLWDVERLLEDAVKREEGEARLRIDGKIYIEDVDTEEIDAKVNSECMKLIERKNDDFRAKLMGFERSEQDGELPLPYSGVPNKNQDEVQRRSRWKYAAKIINTREDKKNLAKLGRISRKAYKERADQQKVENVIVEQDGKLKVASVKEVAGTALKPERNGLEFIYRGVKEAWMNRQLRGEKGGWGRVPAAPPKKVIAKGAKKDAETDAEVDGETEQSAVDAVEDGTDEEKK